jgi:LCP family protein required for cell wall assembly
MTLDKNNFIHKIKPLSRPTTKQIVLMGAGLTVGIVLFIFLRGFVACWRLTALPGIPLPSCSTGGGTVVVNPEGTPIDATVTPTLSIPQAELPPPWDGASRVTVLLIGLDYRDWEQGLGAPRSDTMMLLTIDPQTMMAGVLSVPRDLWVNIPGYGYSKINNAYSFGQADQLPGGGAGLAMKTIENFLGIDINYFAQVDFSTFEQMIDTIGGVCLEVPEEIRVGRTYEHSVLLEPGYQCLDGKSTLGYARARYTEGGDVDRAGRQQQVIQAIMDKVFDPVNFPGLVASAYDLYSQLSSGIHTDMGINDAVRLAVLVKDLPRENIRWGTIDYSMADIGFVDVNGQRLSIMRPYPDAIRDLVDSIFGSGVRVPAAQGDMTQKMQAEAARVAIVNGAGVEGLAARTAEYLTGQGMNVVGYGNMSDYPTDYAYPFPDRTVVIVQGESLYAMEYIQELMGFDTQGQIIFDYNPDATADIIIALGVDWGYNNPMP